MNLNKAFLKVQNELDYLGLFSGKHGYLYQIDVVQSILPSWVMENGFVIDRPTSWYEDLMGFEEGVIYLAHNPQTTLEHGESLTDLIRHEYGHCWAWLEPQLFRSVEYKEAFKTSYFSKVHSGSSYYEELKGEYNVDFLKYSLSDNFTSPYALCNPAEDFAETFCRYVRYKGQITKFKKRPGVYKKLLHIKKMLKRISDIQIMR